MRAVLTWTPTESAPAPAEVHRLQGLPPDLAPLPRIARLLDTAMAAYLDSAEPRGVVGEISRGDFTGVYPGEGRNAPDTPLGAIYPRAERLALFAATVGAGVTERIRDCFARNDPALAVMLDSVASAAADRLADLIGPRYLAMAGADRDPEWRALPYSPGYCGWHVSGQRALFALLRPEEAGITLNGSCLMAPLKSVSGVLVAGPAAIHSFAPDFPFCADCAGKPCRARIASLGRT